MPKLREILRPGLNDDLKIKYQNKEYEITFLFGETNLIPCVNKCPTQKGMYALISPKTDEQPYIQIMYQCDSCDQIKVK